MKEGRIEGRVIGGKYVVAGPLGVTLEMPIAEAREDPKLLAAIRRNGWEPASGDS